MLQVWAEAKLSSYMLQVCKLLNFCFLTVKQQEVDIELFSIYMYNVCVCMFFRSITYNSTAFQHVTVANQQCKVFEVYIKWHYNVSSFFIAHQLDDE